MSLTSVELINVRAFARKWWTFEISPVTVLCGPNGSGKSTVLRSIELVRSNMGARTGPISASRGGSDGFFSTAVRTVDFGSYATLVSRGRTDAEVGFGVSASFEAPPGLIGIHSSLEIGSPPDSQTVPMSCRARFRIAPQPRPGKRFLGTRLTKADFALMYEGRTVATCTLELLTGSPYQPKSKYLQTDYQLTMPRRFFEESGGLDFVAVRGRGDSKSVRFGASLDGLLPSMMVGSLRDSWLRAHDEVSTPNSRVNPIPLPPLLQLAVDAVREALEGVHYIGPLRAPAKRAYALSANAESELAEWDDDYIVSVLSSASEHRVLDWRSPEGQVDCSLLDALNYWLTYFRTGKKPTESARGEIDLHEIQDLFVQPRLRGPYGERPHALADSGFGYSQILPVMTACLAARPGEIILIEQPEVHLHPALQVRMAEMIAHQSRVGKRFVVETHSEHIVDALRVSLAEANLSDEEYRDLHCRVYYVETRGQQPQVADLSVEPDGSVSDWPASFFGESRELARRLVRARVSRARGVAE